MINILKFPYGLISAMAFLHEMELFAGVPRRTRNYIQGYEQGCNGPTTRSRLVTNGTLYLEYCSGGQRYNVPREVGILLRSCTVHCTRIVLRVTRYCVVGVCVNPAILLAQSRKLSLCDPRDGCGARPPLRSRSFKCKGQNEESRHGRKEKL